MRKLVIVGGGSAGWIAAAYLNGALNKRGEERNVDITLIESPDTPRISVGEATIPSIGHILGVVGIDETEFMKATEATFKQSIKYVNWKENDGSFYHHPFSRMRPGPIDTTGRDWLNSQQNIPFMETVSAQPIVCELALCPKPMRGTKLSAPYKYAFHMNAQHFADYLRDFSIERGVTHIRQNVKQVMRGEKEDTIKSVLTDSDDEFEADLFIDCTGQKALLIGKTLGEPLEDYSQYLLADQALVSQFSYDKYFPGIVRPYTTATALSAGWVWDIPMQTRRSVGYVHASAFVDIDSAHRELAEYQGVAPDVMETRLIKFKVGQRRRAWVGNCVAIGLSGGFIEPLESTGLYLSDLASVMLAEYFPFKTEHMEPFARRVNRIIHNRYYEILDFINMHYCLTRRQDTEFWKAVQRPEHITDSLQAKLKFWRLKAPTSADFDDADFYTSGSLSPHQTPTGMDTRPPVDTAGLWNHESYEAILFGMGFGDHYKLAKVSPSQVLPQIIPRLRESRQKLPPHHIWLHHALGMKQWPVSKPPAGWS